MRTSRKNKKKVARRLRFQEAMEHGIADAQKRIMAIPVFQTESWNKRKKKIEKRVDQTMANQQMMKAKKEYKNSEKGTFHIK